MLNLASTSTNFQPTEISTHLRSNLQSFISKIERAINVSVKAHGRLSQQEIQELTIAFFDSCDIGKSLVSLLTENIDEYDADKSPCPSTCQAICPWQNTHYLCRWLKLDTIDNSDVWLSLLDLQKTSIVALNLADYIEDTILRSEKDPILHRSTACLHAWLKNIAMTLKHIKVRANFG